MAEDSDYGPPGTMRSGGSSDYMPLTVGELRNALDGLDPDVKITFGSTIDAQALIFYRFKWRGEKSLQIELNEMDPNDPWLKGGE